MAVVIGNLSVLAGAVEAAMEAGMLRRADPAFTALIPASHLHGVLRL